MIARYFPKYADFLMCIIILCGASMLILLFLPESPHWYILNGKREDFLATMTEAAGYNGADLTDLEQLVPLPKPLDRNETKAQLQYSLWSAELLRPTLTLIFSWMSMAVIYYGNSATYDQFSLAILSTSTLGLNFCIEEFRLIDSHLTSIAVIALVEIPAYLRNNSIFY